MNKKIIVIALIFIMITSIGIISLSHSQAIRFNTYVKSYSTPLYLNITLNNFIHNKIFYYLIGYSVSNITPQWNNYWFYVINVTQYKSDIPVFKAYTNENLSDELGLPVNTPLFDYNVNYTNKTQIQVFNNSYNSFTFEIIATPIAQNITNSNLPFFNNYSIYSVITNVYEMSLQGFFGGKNNYSNLLNLINLWISENDTSIQVLYSITYFYSVNINISINAIQKFFNNQYSVYFIDSGYKYSIYIYRETNNLINGNSTFVLIDSFNITNNTEINLTLGQYMIIAEYENHKIYYNFTLESNEIINLNNFTIQFNVFYFIIAIIITFLISITIFYLLKNIILTMISFNLVFIIFMSLKIMYFNYSWLFLLIFGNIFYVLIKILGGEK